MTIDLLTIVIVVCAIIGIWWGHSRLPSPWNLVLVAVVVIGCVLVLLKVFGVA